MKDRERRLRRFPGKGEEVTTVQKHLPGRGAGSQLPLLEDFRRQLFSEHVSDIVFISRTDWGLHSGEQEYWFSLMCFRRL